MSEDKRLHSKSSGVKIVTHKPLLDSQPGGVDPGALIDGTAEYAEMQKAQEQRGNWGGKFDCLMSMVNYAVGLGNVWRFPYLCFKHGGGAFLVPYVICWALAAAPIFFMEVSLGQHLQRAGIGIWKVCPVFKGVGFANTIIASYCCVYYCIIISWALFYLFSSFRTILPWTICNQDWIDVPCSDRSNTNRTTQEVFFRNQTYFVNETQTPVELFWERKALQTTAGIDDFGTIRWELALLLVFCFVLVYFALWKGIVHAKKMIYFCALCPYVLLFILLGRGVSLPGATLGLKYYLYPNVTKLLTAEVWKDAGTQVFYSYGIGFGTLVALGSYNTYTHNCYRDCLIMCGINGGTSFLAGFVIFSVLGYMATEAGKTIDEVVKSGVGLAFLVYPEAVTQLPINQLWAVLFFSMIALLGMDSQVCMVEGVVSAISDMYPTVLHKYKKYFVMVFCTVMLALGLPMVSQSGQYWLTLVDNFGPSGISLLFVVFFEVVGIAWGFGAERLYKELEDMLGFRPRKFWIYLWKFSAPLMCVILFLLTLIKHKPLTYSDGIPYPDWAQALGLMISLSSMLCIPAYAIYYIYTCPGATLMEKLKKSLEPKASYSRQISYSRQASRNEFPKSDSVVLDTKMPFDITEMADDVTEDGQNVFMKGPGGSSQEMIDMTQNQSHSKSSLKS